jgi:hypothetical protein
MGFTQCFFDKCCFTITRNGKIMILGVHVDDFLVAYDNDDQISWFLRELGDAYSLKDLGEPSSMLGLQYEKTDSGLNIHQDLYTTHVLETFGFEDAHPTLTPDHINDPVLNKDRHASKLEQFPLNCIVGSLQWLSVQTRPDISQAVSRLGQYLANPIPIAFVKAARILRYLRGTRSHGLKFSSQIETSLMGYVDADWAGDKTDYKSQSGYIFFLAGGPVSWMSRKQRLVALSSTESEIIAATEAAKEAKWLEGALRELDFPSALPVILREDNLATILLSETSVNAKRTKHIGIRYAFLNEVVKDGIVKLVKVHTRDNTADLLTKALPREAFQRHCLKMVTD